MKSSIIIKPIISEKTELLSSNTDAPKYTFLVNKKANKIEIAKAIEGMFEVSVSKVNTAIMPVKTRVRFTRSGTVKGRKPSYKKATVTLGAGEEINFYGES